ncbi:sugar phosphate nucleotidyltransferase [Paenibacillus sp. JNUCC31]
MAAGYATRLYPLTQDTPKSLLPVQRAVPFWNRQNDKD